MKMNMTKYITIMIVFMFCIGNFLNLAASALTIEEQFSRDIGGSAADIKQVGYDLFMSSGGSGSGKYDGSYQLSIGETVEVYCWGNSLDLLNLSGGSALLAPVSKTKIDPQGNLFVAGLGLVQAENKTIEQVEKQLQSIANQKFSNVKVKIAIADKDDFSVFVYGYVNKPSKVSIGSNSSIVEAISGAGGVQKIGSLRNVSYKSNGKVQKIDLYNVMFKGNDLGIRLKPNDIIFVDKIGSVVALTNGVKQPGIYELAAKDSLAGIIEYAGGVAQNTAPDNVNIRSYDAQIGQRKAKDFALKTSSSITLKGGDIIAFESLYGGTDNIVTIEGSVKHPKTVEYKQGMKLSDILKSQDELQDQTFMTQAVITRLVGADKVQRVIPVSLDAFFSGVDNPVLMSRDVITVYKNANSDVVDVYGCINMPKKIPFNEKLTLKDVLADVYFTKIPSNLAGVMYVSNDKNSTNAEQSTVAIKTDDENKLTASVAMVDIAQISADNVAVEIIGKNDTRVFYLYDVLVQKDATNHIKIEKGDKVFFRPLRGDEIIKTVKVSGYVNRPGVYYFVDGKTLTDMIEMAGGLQDSANFKGTVFTRASLAAKERELALDKNQKDIRLLHGLIGADSTQTEDTLAQRQKLLEGIASETSDILTSTIKYKGRISLNITDNNVNSLPKAENILIQDGDEIYIPKIVDHVTVMGEVYNEASFIYKKGAHAAYYVDLVGGYTQNARTNQIYKIDINGKAKKIGRKLTAASIEPGDSIIVPRKIRGKDWLTTTTQVLQSIVNLALGVFLATKI